VGKGDGIHSGTNWKKVTDRLNKLTRTLARLSHDNDVWPVVLVLLAVLIPAVFLLWLMNQAMRNERLAARQKLADAYHGVLSSAQSRIEQAWMSQLKELEQLGRVQPPSAAFARCVALGGVDSVVILDDSGRVIYPNAPSAPDSAGEEQSPEWTRANQLEYRRHDFLGAARLYDDLAKRETNADLAARAWQAQVRCYVEAGETNVAIGLIDQVLAGERFRKAVDAQGRLIAANAELMALELSPNRASPSFESRARRLAARLLDYENPFLASSQRRFLMKELKQLAPVVDLPLLEAEELAAQFKESHPGLANDSASRRAPLADLWQCSTPNHRVVALIGTDKLSKLVASVTAPEKLRSNSELALLPPGSDSRAAVTVLPAGSMWPGWQLALAVKDQALFTLAAEHQTGIYLWTTVLVVAVVSVLTLMAVRFMNRQAALARLKNDLAATVSHELKTPLAGMRVLVDTLLESGQLDEKRVREYLQLIAQENERLSRLIQNFLDFSRLQRKEHALKLEPTTVGQIIEATTEAARDRFEVVGCQFEVQVKAGLAVVVADIGAMVTALLNLLENAWKYSGDIKQITLGSHAENGHVDFWVQDNGIGIAPHESKKIFRSFYQVDRRLSRDAAGCGLGLSIVEFIASAHNGSASVESKLGCGSKFTIRLPAALNTNGAGVAVNG
jgi:signal transduction histidine kinase